MKHILVTGCNGQLGNELRVLSAPLSEGDDYAFHFTDAAELDITQRDAIYRYVEDHHISTIINCAAFTAVDKAESQPELCDLLNHVAPGYLAEAADSVGGTMIHVSTDYVFDGRGCTPYREDDPCNPQTVYGRTKLAGEERVIRGCAGAVVVRTAWLYSTFGHNFVKTMLKLGREREELGVVFDQLGSPTYARDLAGAILQMVCGDTLAGVYHFTNEGVCSWYDFTRTIFALSGIDGCRVSPLHTDEYPTPAQRPHYSVLDKTKVKTAYGIEIRWWADALKDCLSRMK